MSMKVQFRNRGPKRNKTYDDHIGPDDRFGRDDMTQKLKLEATSLPHLMAH